MAWKDARTLLGAADGHVLVLAADGSDDWKETRRWDSWATAPAAKFGGRIDLAAADGRLWGSDRDRHRVLCFALEGSRLLALFGAADQPGNDLAHLDQPGTLAASGERAVVFDSGNQRIVRLRLRSRPSSAAALRGSSF